MAMRVRRPTDFFRLVAASVFLVLIVTLGALAQDTTLGVETDVTDAVNRLPGPILSLLNIVTGVGFLLLPIAVSLDLLLRHRGRQLVDALLALVVAVAVVLLANAMIRSVDALQGVYLALSSFHDGRLSPPLSVLLVSVIAFLTVARIGGRRGLLPLATVVVGASIVTALLGHSTTFLGAVVDILVGIIVGLAIRIILGTVPSQPPGEDIAVSLLRRFPGLTRLERQPADREGRHFSASLEDGRCLDVLVLDRDQEGSGLAYRVWRMLRVRGPAAPRPLFSVQRTLEHEALMAYALRAAGARTPALLTTAEVASSSGLLAYHHVRGSALRDIDPELVGDDVLIRAWEQLAALRRAQIAHRGLTPEHLLVTQERQVYLTGLRAGEIAATDLPMRLDVAQLLVSLSLVAGAERAVRAGVDVIGLPAIMSALPVLQPLALARTTRRALRRNRSLLREIRTAVLQEPTPELLEEPGEIRLQRLSARTLFLVVGGSFAAYVLLSQLSDVDLGNLLSSADKGWVLVALLCSALTYVGAALSLDGFVLERLSLMRTFLAQVAASFVSLVAPPAVGGVALNARFLQKSGVDGAVAVATVGVWQLVAFAVHLLLLVAVGVVAGTQAETTFDPPQGAVIGVVVVLLAVGVVMSLPWGRRVLLGRLASLGRRVLPRLLEVAQRPLSLAVGIGGNVLLNAAYCAALIASVSAFGGSLNWAAISLVYLAGSAIGAASPTPGGLGAVEAALAAGLTAAGLDGTTAVSAVLLFRLVTYWLPVAPGWVAFRFLQSRGAL